MNSLTEGAAAEQAAREVAASAGRRGAWRTATLAIALSFVALAVLYAPTFAGLYEMWERTDTYGHWILVLPISLYAAWSRREDLARLHPDPSAIGVAAVALISVGWAAARVIDVNVVQELAVHALIAALVLAIAGPRALRILAFPIVFLIFVIPLWTHLIPVLQDHTASVAAWSVRAIGVPLYHDGYYLTIPRGQFVVAEVCAGLRFLLATLCITAFYAHLHIPSAKLGLAFVAIGAVVAVVTNWLRVDMIVLIGHYVGMDSPLVGGYHTHVGWVVFAIALIPLFWIGRRLADRAERLQDEAAPSRSSASPDRTPSRRAPPWSLAVLTLAALAVGPALYARSQSPTDAGPAAADGPRLRLPAGAEGWRGPSAGASPLEPRYVGPDQTLSASYALDARTIGVHVAYYASQGRGREVVNDRNHPYSKALFTRKASGTLRCPASAGAFDVTQWRLEGAGGRRVVWHWFEVGGVATSNPYVAKVLQLRSLVGGDPAALSVTLSTEVAGDRAATQTAMEAFCQTHGSALALARMRP